MPCTGPLRPTGRVTPLVVPPGEFATIVHPGPDTGIDRAYGSLATYVTQHALAVDGPIREYYLAGRRRHPGRGAVAHADLLADLPHRARARRSITGQPGSRPAALSTAISRATAPVNACSGGVA